MMRIGICDDEAKAVQVSKDFIEKFLKKNKCEYEIHEFLNPEELYHYVRESIYDLDLLFLDIEIGESNGVEVAKKLEALDARTKIVFLTNYLCYSSKVYEVDYCYFVLKKDLEKYLPKIIEKQIQQKSKVARERIVVMVKGRKIILLPMDIQYLEREKRSTLAVCVGETVRTSSGLTELQAQLGSDYFVRCHNSYIVNLNFVKEFCRNELILRNGKKVPISRRYLNDVRRAFARWLGEDI
ncbi:LytR/AlgR family response regulator transcription factor [uncultured Robinsoniella sp.]|uniref:LytR/AlgR family response regulator transcription factor n=1 Tax=uncultured Robinsoniella sp. TaxID=904190 RepID=UPI00374E2BD2